MAERNRDMQFLKPGTRVYVGSNYTIPAVIVKVSIIRDLTVFYTVEWWRGHQSGELEDVITRDLERWMFSTEEGVRHVDTEPVDAKPQEGSI